MRFRQPPDRTPEYLELLVPEEARSQEEQEFAEGMRRECNERLRGAGLQMFFLGPNITNHGYRLGFQDKEGRRYFCGFTYDEGIFIGENYPDSYAQELVTLVCERALLAREVHFENERAVHNVLAGNAEVSGPAPAEITKGAPAGVTVH